MQALLRLVGLGCAAALVVACGGTGSDAPASGGAAGTGGSGTAGSGASGASGSGTAGTGTAGTGTAGTAGTGTAGSGGSSGGACVSGSVAASKMINFDTTTENWKVIYTSAATGVTPVAQSMVAVTWDGTDDSAASATSGSVQAVIPYTAASQYVGIGVSLATPIDITGRIVHAMVQVKSGVDTDPANLASHGAGSKIYVKSGMDYEYVAGTYTPINTVGDWIEITLDGCNPDYVDTAHLPFDPSDVRELGIQFDTDGMAVSPTTGTLLIDSIQY